MNQHASNGEDIEMEVVSGELLFIDPLYWDDIRAEHQLLDTLPTNAGSAAFVHKLNTTFFPYGGNILGHEKVPSWNSVFKLPIRRIRSYDTNDEYFEQQLLATNTTVFGLDSGSLLILDLANFYPLLQLLEADELFEASTADFSLYQAHINQALGNRGWAYVQSPGLDNGFDFIGSGSYFLEKLTGMPNFTS
ncbi:hypothetical protein [Hymenobacter guriensis]|uniref:Uncharacterized protein n=1 Tax=Hymenobacter guriensis TaxID=2793065 RepID=A0ABS0L7U7_9BACT|nr:hypothetical protein [Hymenobacter guriensis]MBG8556216.1 hypothetical protein [Hymenobacter guriensis]